MAIKKRAISVLKNIRQNKRRYLLNKSIKMDVKSSIKAFKSNEKEGKEASFEKLKLSFKKIDKAAKKGIFHKNKAARLKSKLSKRASTIV
ncbi:MAG: 30S ribosomal protein S20 [bacterium]